MKSRSIRSFAVLAAAGLLVGAFAAAPADAAKRKKKPAPPPCAAYEPGTEGADLETVVITDAATKDAPVEIKIAAPPGIGVGGEEATETFIGHAYSNIQIDSAVPGAPLTLRLEMPAMEDYDLYLLNNDSTEAARAAGFNPAPVVYNDTGAGGHTEEGAEMIDAFVTDDCQGFTVESATASGMGGELLLKAWLGE